MPGEPAAGAWLEEQLERALERIDALTREVARAQDALATREQEAEGLSQSLAILEGRTRRHEAALDALPELRGAVRDVEDRLAGESALRRDAASSTERGHDRDAASAHLLERDVIEIDRRLVAIEQALRAAAEREAHHEAAISTSTRTQQTAEARLDALQAQVAALADAVRRDGGDRAGATEALDDARLHIGAVEARTDVMVRDLQQVKDEMLLVRRALDRETAVTDLVEQVRALRLRVEEGLADLDRRVDAQEVTGSADGEAQRVIRVHLATLDRAVMDVAAQVEGQRQVLLEHFQRVTAAAEDAGRRQTEEIDRQVRAARESLVRLAERADEATREQPL
ncbi:MAG: hypothetical protein WC211_09860 [Dehalococcoidia bacterium]